MNVIHINGKTIDLDTFEDTSPNYTVTQPLLKHVIFEISHEPNLEAMAKKYLIAEIFDKNNFKREYPVNRPNQEEGISFKDDKMKYNVFSQRTSVECFEYVSFEDFQIKVKNFFTAYHEKVQIKDIYRVGLRYINKISIDKNDKLHPSEMFTLNMNLLDMPIQFFSADFTHLIENDLFARSIFAPNTASSHPELYWDNDVFLPLEMSFFQAIGLLPVLHQAITNLFLSFLTEKAKNILLRYGDK